MSTEQYRQRFALALRSYNAMETTKRRHFDYMTMLENKKKKFNLDATELEAEQLEHFLRDHHEEVQVFKQLCDDLKRSDGNAHKALFEYIGNLNKVMDVAGSRLVH